MSVVPDDVSIGGERTAQFFQIHACTERGAIAGQDHTAHGIVLCRSLNGHIEIGNQISAQGIPLVGS